VRVQGGEGAGHLGVRSIRKSERAGKRGGGNRTVVGCDRRGRKSELFVIEEGTLGDARKKVEENVRQFS
jgi:hypothetical protein